MSPAYRILRIFLLATVYLPLAVTAATSKPGEIDFNAQIRPIIASKCYHCHGPDEGSREAGLRLDLREEAIKDRKGRFAIKPGDVKKSELVARVFHTDPDEVMPPVKTGHPLNIQEKELLKKWIEQGAPYATHWAFVKPTRSALPKVKAKSWTQNPVDHFILAKLETNKLKPSTPADRHSLIRRLSIDLTGLPPTPSEVDEFVKDKSPAAYEKTVDRLMNSPAFGEKWARNWLDLARYADSAGYGSDPLRLTIWPYRDWLIKALNDNMPYDQFTIEQIAGDLLENPTEDQRVATAFHRNTMTNTEGGTDDEEWRVAAVKDRANVTVQAWMGLTLGCAQCHTHKFDPITQKEYYQFYSFFNQTEDNDQPNESPTLALPSAEERKKTAEMTGKIARLEQKLKSGSEELQSELAEWEKTHNQPDLWTALEVVETKSAKGTEFEKLPDHSIVTGTAAPEQDTYSISTRLTVSNITAIRLDALTDARLPASGPGRSTSGNFILSDLRVTFQPDAKDVPKARFVRVEIPGNEKILSLAEVQVFDGTNNIAPGKKASQSSLGFEGVPERAVDGNTDGDYTKNSTTHTDTETNPWWELDLGAEGSIDAIVIWNRAEVPERLSDFKVTVLNADRKPVWEDEVKTFPSPSVRLSLMEERAVTLRNATASIDQKKNPVSDAIDGKAGKKKGWGIGPGVGKPQNAVFEVATPLRPGILKFELTQMAGAKQTLGHFRLSVTTVPTPVFTSPEDIATVLTIAPTKRSAEQTKELVQWFQEYAPSTGKLRKEIDTIKMQLDKIKPLAVPVMVEYGPDKQRKTYLFNKGNYLEPTDMVTPGTPNALHPWPANAPTNRLGVAKWLVDRENPLTARVAANRMWAQLFGTGLVETEEDFGTQGTPPSHPELLDWLAMEFMEPTDALKSSTSAKGSVVTGNDRYDAPTPWNVKRLLKILVTSATYQQRSKVTPELLQKDPRNRLISRAPRSRLDAEMVRDQALFVGGLLSKKIGGPSVYPPQPDGLWRAAFNGQRTYGTSTGEERYRRGLYTTWRRTVPYPSMATFDAPSRESCTFRRLPTNTPLQAYVTLNDPVYVEAAQSLGRRLVRDGGSTPEQRIRYGLRLVLARPERDADVQELMKLYHAELKHYQGAEAEAVKMATNPLGALPEGLQSAEAAAWTVIGNVLLNMDGVLTKS